jgi:hypothetical protein
MADYFRNKYLKNMKDINIFNLLCLNPHAEHSHEQVHTAIHSVSLVMHLDKHYITSPQAVSAFVDQTILNDLLTMVNNKQAFKILWLHIAQHGKEKWNSTWNAHAKNNSNFLHPIPAYFTHQRASNPAPTTPMKRKRSPSVEYSNNVI